GGSIFISASDGVGLNQYGGSITIKGGNSSGSSTGGHIHLIPGSSSNGVSGSIVLLNLPSSPNGLPNGALWTSEGILKIA
ncbi:hypothetical protein AB0216_26865, partial [Klebsiella pneumoniae]